MGKRWLSIGTCFSPIKDMNHQKPKKKWFGKQKSFDSIALSADENPPIEPSITSPPLFPPPPSPPSEPVVDPQPLLLPPSPPPRPPPLPSSSARGSKNADFDESNDEQTRQAMAVATAAAGEAAVVVAHAAAEVVNLVTATREMEKAREESAAIKIQTAYRCYMARQTLRVLRGTTRLRELLQGQYAKRQATAMLRSMQTLTRLQTQVQERRTRLSEENKARHRLLQQRLQQKEPYGTTTSSILGEFDVSNKTKDQIEARLQYRKDASVRRERALAYAYSRQKIWRNSSKLPHQIPMDPNDLHWGWSWLERWMASRPWDVQAKTTYNENDQIAVTSPVKSSFNSEKAMPRVRKTVSLEAVQMPTEIGSKNLQSLRGRGSSSLNVGSNSLVPSSLGSKEAVAKSRSAVTSTTSNLSSQKRPVVSIKDRASTPASSGTITRLYSDSDKNINVLNGEKKKSRGRSR